MRPSASSLLLKRPQELNPIKTLQLKELAIKVRFFLFNNDTRFPYLNSPNIINNKKSHDGRWCILGEFLFYY